MSLRVCAAEVLMHVRVHEENDDRKELGDTAAHHEDFGDDRLNGEATEAACAREDPERGRSARNHGDYCNYTTKFRTRRSTENTKMVWI